MIDYQTFHQIRHLCDEEHLSAAQIAAALALDERTVSKWIGVKIYQPRKAGKRQSKLDSFKSTIVRLLAQHPYTAAQLLHRLREAGYEGGYSILKAFVQHVRPAPAPAFPTLHFAPGQAAQVDWDDAGFLPVRPHSTPAFVFCPGAQLQPQALRRVHPGPNTGTLHGLSPARL